MPLILLLEYPLGMLDVDTVCHTVVKGCAAAGHKQLMDHPVFGGWSIG